MGGHIRSRRVSNSSARGCCSRRCRRGFCWDLESLCSVPACLFRLPEDEVVAAEYLGWLLGISSLEGLTVVTGVRHTADPVPAVSLPSDAIIAAVFTEVEATVVLAGMLGVGMND